MVPNPGHRLTLPSSKLGLTSIPSPEVKLALETLAMVKSTFSVLSPSHHSHLFGRTLKSSQIGATFITIILKYASIVLGGCWVNIISLTCVYPLFMRLGKRTVRCIAITKICRVNFWKCWNAILRAGGLVLGKQVWRVYLHFLHFEKFKTLWLTNFPPGIVSERLSIDPCQNRSAGQCS